MNELAQGPPIPGERLRQLDRDFAPSLLAGARAMIVMKFGGTSVEDAKAIDRVASIVTGPPISASRWS